MQPHFFRLHLPLQSCSYFFIRPLSPCRPLRTPPDAPGRSSKAFPPPLGRRQGGLGSLYRHRPAAGGRPLALRGGGDQLLPSARGHCTVCTNTSFRRVYPAPSRVSSALQNALYFAGKGIKIAKDKGTLIKISALAQTQERQERGTRRERTENDHGR
jgi:hypothetical protein